MRSVVRTRCIVSKWWINGTEQAVPDGLGFACLFRCCPCLTQSQGRAPASGRGAQGRSSSMCAAPPNFPHQYLSVDAKATLLQLLIQPVDKSSKTHSGLAKAPARCHSMHLPTRTLHLTIGVAWCAELGLQFWDNIF